MNNNLLMPVITIASILSSVPDYGAAVVFALYGIIAGAIIHPFIAGGIGALTGRLHPRWTAKRGFWTGLVSGILSILITWISLAVWLFLMPHADFDYPTLAAIFTGLLAGWITPVLFMLIRPPRSTRR